MTRLARVALSLFALLALLVARPASATASTRGALDASSELLPLAGHYPAESTPVPSGCAERAPSSARASTAKGETDGAQRALAREHRRVGASNTQKNPHYAGNAMPDQLPEDGFVYFYHPDHLGSTSYVTDAAGDVYEHTGYFPHGETWIDQANSSEALPYLFTGKELDQETGLYYFGARYYDPQTALWQSADPIDPRWGNPRTLNVYHYSLHNPLTVHDPDGREERAAFQAGMALWARALENADRPAPSNTGAGAFFGGMAREAMRTVVAAPEAMVAEATAAIQATAESGPGSMVQPLWSMMTAPANTVVNAATDVVDVGRGAVAAATMGGSDEQAGAATVAPVVGAMKLAATALGVRGADKVRGTEAGSAGARPNQLHHFATNKNKAWTPRLEKIAGRYGLDLDDMWNKEALPHLGRHPNAYHEFVERGMTRAAREAGSDKGKFLDLFDRYVKQPVRDNPELLRKDGWE